MNAKADGGKDGVLNVGIDLGTSRSSISTSDGQKKVIKSYVGWPADMVANKVLKKKILIGEEALKNRVMLDLHRPLERGLIKEGSEKDLRAVRELLTHLLNLVGIKGGSKGGQAVRAVVGVPAEAMRVNKQQLRNAMAGIVDSLMIVSEPFAVAYGLDSLLHALIIDIGAGTTDFCVMNGRYPTEEDQRTLTTAGDSVDEQLHHLISERYPEVNFSEHMVRDWK
ncbi:MAG: rod shape-determining protein, partial [Acidobacteriota bacterium]|nr:rod shape-determining protein [Acidobacteriota bacterium]